MNIVLVFIYLCIQMLERSGDVLPGGFKRCDEMLSEASNVVVGSVHGAYEGCVR